MKNRRANLLLLLAAAAAATAVSACSDEEGTGDDDDGTIVPTRCALYWARENAIDGSLDFFSVDMPIGAWVTDSAQTYGGAQLNARQGLFAYRSPDGSLSAAAGVAMTTGGTFAIDVAGTTAGAAVAYTDSSSEVLVDGRTAVDPPPVGTGGAGSFAGVWSDPAATTFGEIDWATGATLSVTYLGSSLVLGGSELDGMSAYGQCYDAAATSASAAMESIFQQVQQHRSRSGTRHGKGSR